MPNTKTAAKRMKQIEKKRMRNKQVKTRMKTAVREFILSLKKGDRQQAAHNFTMAKRIIDKAATKGVIHKNFAARKKSQLAKKLSKLAG